jgi:membrane associated rhomboid family serine protease
VNLDDDTPSWMKSGTQKHSTPSTSTASTKLTKGASKKSEVKEEPPAKKSKGSKTSLRSSDSSSRFSKPISLKNRLIILAAVSIILWVIEIANMYEEDKFRDEGLHPRDGETFGGVIIMPLIHGNVFHFLFNWIPVVLTGFMLLGRGWLSMIALAVIWVGGGFLLWCVGKPGNHYGGELIMTAMLMCLTTSCVMLRRPREALAVVASLVVIAALLILKWSDLKDDVGWDSCLVGLFLGFILSFFSSKLTRLVNRG